MYYSNLDHFKSAAGYEIEGVWYPRVTSIVSIKAKPALYKFYGEQESFEAGERAKNLSAEEGSLIHETMEAILAGKEVAIPDSIKPAINAFLDFKNKNKVIPYLIEERVVSKNHWYAGTIDVLAELNGKLGLIDIKTSYAIYRDYNLQTAAYAQALEENGFPPLTRWILRIDQSRKCLRCLARLREKGGNIKVRGGSSECNHIWGPMIGEIEIQELNNFEEDFKAFLACKNLWEWEYQYWIKQLRK